MTQQIQMELERTTRTWALSNNMDPHLACAIVEKESSWNPYAIRPESESGFMSRYGAAYTKLVRESASKNDDKWLRFEDIFYCSYGLMQTMYPCIIEAFPETIKLFQFPTELCKPDFGLAWGCKFFMLKLKLAKGSTQLALQYWNGGADKGYAADVLSRVDKYKISV